MLTRNGSASLPTYGDQFGKTTRGTATKSGGNPTRWINPVTMTNRTMQTPSQLYWKLKLWDAKLGLVHRSINIAVGLVTLASALGLTYHFW
jgi:hypothetical protein